MKRLFGVMVVVVCAMALGLNLQYAFDGYGIKTGALHKVVLADGTGTGSAGGTGTGTGTGGTGDGTGTDTGTGGGGTYIPGAEKGLCSTLEVTTKVVVDNKLISETIKKYCIEGTQTECEYGTQTTDSNYRITGFFDRKHCGN